MPRVNVLSCKLEERLDRGEFRRAAAHVTERLGARVLGASVFEMRAGEKHGPYHYHHGVEEWMYVVSGTPIHRSPRGERALEPGDLVAFPSGPGGAHTVRGPGRVVIFSAGARGWGEAFVTAYPDSDKIGAAPGVRFRRGDALRSWSEDDMPASVPLPSLGGAADPLVNVAWVTIDVPPDGAGRRRCATRAARMCSAPPISRAFPRARPVLGSC